MTKCKLFIFSIAAIFMTGNVFAATVTTACNFPQHFTVKGPAGTHIVEIEADSESDFIVSKITKNSFDIADQTQCKGDGLNGLTLKVGIDDHHYSEIIFFDDHDGQITVVGSSEFNGFHLTKFTHVNMDYEIVYIQKEVI